MPFHVEISRGVSRARVFNYDDERLRREVLEPWMRGRPLLLGDKEWIPAKSELRVLEGPELGSTDLNFGRGWDSAERSGRDVTVSVLKRSAPGKASAEVAVLAETPWGRETVAEALERLGAEAVDWAEAREAALSAARDGDAAGNAVVVLAVESAEPVSWWLFEAGLALGALGARAIVVGLGDQEAPEPLRNLGVIRLDPARPDSLQDLAQRLRLAGLELAAAEA